MCQLLEDKIREAEQMNKKYLSILKFFVWYGMIFLSGMV